MTTRQHWLLPLLRLTLLVIGVSAVVGGVLQLSVPAAWITAGVGLLLLAYDLSRWEAGGAG